MSTGNYDHDNFVRVDCAASSEQFRIKMCIRDRFT